MTARDPEGTGKRRGLVPRPGALRASRSADLHLHLHGEALLTGTVSKYKETCKRSPRTVALGRVHEHECFIKPPAPAGSPGSKSINRELLTILCRCVQREGNRR